MELYYYEMWNLVLLLLVISIVLLNLIFIVSAGSFLALYYIIWVIGFGSIFWKNRERIEKRLVEWNIGKFKKFLLLGFLMIFIEEIFAGFSMHLGVATSLGDMAIGIMQFWAFNFLALPGFIIGWALLLQKVSFERREIFVLAGIFGLFAEKTLMHVFTIPIMGILLILPTMFTYALIISPSVISFRESNKRRTLTRASRYALGLIVPFVVSIPFVLLLTYLKFNHPEIFPPAGFVG